MIGRFNPAHDLFLAHFDLKTDVDDLHSIAGVATMLKHPRLSGVRYHAVAGAYGMQDGPYVPPGDLFRFAFGEHWSDAHDALEPAVDEVATLVRETIEHGGDVWIAEAGQSDFSAAVLRRVTDANPELAIGQRFHVVQHSDWNESVTKPGDLEYLQSQASYHRIPDGNTIGNGTPGFRAAEPVDWRSQIHNDDVAAVWEIAIETADRYNGADGRYLNEAIQSGGLDFSDVSETCWIFGFEHLPDAQAFLETFGTRSP